MKIRYSLLIILLFFKFTSFAQNEKTDESTINKTIDRIAKEGFTFNVTESGSSSIKIGMGIHFWFREMQMNPGTIERSSLSPISHYSDIALRRMRMSFRMNIEGRHFLYAQFGLTSESNYNTLNSGMFFHDLWYKVKIAPKTYLGAGMHMWNGLSRLSNVTYATQMTLDNPGVNFPNVNVSDDFVRQYGVFFQGQLGKIDYQFSWNQPLMPTNSSKIFNDKEIEENGNVGVAYNRYHSNFSYKGYMAYSFLNHEKAEITPFKRMTYYGKSGRFLDLGAGFQFVSNASSAFDGEKIVHYNQTGLSVDIWYEEPLANESVLNIYTAYYNYGYGPNYLKISSVMGGFASPDPNKETAAQGSGIEQYIIGTGDILYFSISYVLPTTIYDSKKKIMPFAAVYYKDFEGLNEASFQTDFGIQYLVLSNNVKISAQYSFRPVYKESTLEVDEHKGALIVQLQAKF
ncbi:MAG: hypothetical protein KAH10_02550 [Flavobacteriales bacterium]|nr:hypothetical protein [Flavobacteriales bacterium]